MMCVYVCIHVHAKKKVHEREVKALKFIGRILSTETVLCIVANLGHLESLKLQMLIQIVRTSIPFQDTVWM